MSTPTIAPVSLAVVTVSFYSGEELGECLRSLDGASGQHPRVYVVDNAPADRLDLAPAQGEVEVLKPGANLGYGTAINRAVSLYAAETDWVLITNPDVVFAPGSIDLLLAEAVRNSDIGAVGPRIRSDDGSIYPSARELPSLGAGIGHALLRTVWPGNPWSRAYLREDTSQSASLTPVAAGWLSGSCMLLRRSAFEAINGFDQRFFMYFEDVDLCERMRAAGWKVMFVPRAEVRHSGGTSTAREAEKMRREHHHSAYLYLAKRYSRWYHAPLRVALRLALEVRAHLHARTATP